MAQHPSTNRQHQQTSRGVIIALIVIALIFIPLLAIGLHQNFGLNNPITSNSDGTSKAAVYTKISDFGSYSDWAQQQLQQGYPMCSIQNALAKTDQDVATIPTCGTTISCTSINLAITSATTCTTQQQ